MAATRSVTFESAVSGAGCPYLRLDGHRAGALRPEAPAGVQDVESKGRRGPGLQSLVTSATPARVEDSSTMPLPSRKAAMRDCSARLFTARGIPRAVW